MNRRDWYTRVNAAWPDQVPALTGPEAVKAARRLFRFCKVGIPTLKLTSGNRHNWGRRDGTFSVNPEAGWRTMVHSVSHWVHYLRTLGEDVAPHDKSHARLELKLIRQVVKRGWLDGRLRPQPKVVADPSPTAMRDARLEHAEAMLRRAQTRLKRAETINRKWVMRVRRLKKKAARPAEAC